ncbi:Zinc finger HIT domain-containing protein [Drosera capensis]
MEEKNINIITAAADKSSSSAAAACAVICRVCEKQYSQYTCPRCNTRYCSLHCYKSHCLSCTESFMRENVLEELRQLKPDDGAKKKMLEILKRFHSEEEDVMEDDETMLSEETIQKVLSGGEIEYDDLSSDEKELFRRAVASGELSKMIEPWDPWWLKPSARTLTLSRDGTQLVKPLSTHDKPESSKDDSESDSANEIPAGPETPLLPVSNLTTAEPSPLIAFHLIDILYSYCFTLRLHNGDWRSDAVGAAMSVLSISSVLGHEGQPETLSEVLSYCLEQTCSPAFRDIGGLQFGFAILDDVTSLLLLNGSAIICGLCDLQRLIQTAAKGLRSEKSRKAKRAELKSLLKHAERKVYFIMCWVHEQEVEVWLSLASVMKVEKASILEYHAKGRSFDTGRKTMKEGKTLIEEVK